MLFVKLCINAQMAAVVVSMFIDSAIILPDYIFPA